MPDAAVVKPLQQRLFAAPEARVYAVLDGASVPKLPQALWKHDPTHVCLYRGELEPDLAATAPYLVQLEPDSPFTQWVLQDGWGKHWGVFAVAPADLPFLELRKHFRKFLMVGDPQGKLVYFRYYDPRVLQAYLPTCNSEELKTIFGPVVRYCAESRDGGAAVLFSYADGQLRTEKTALSAPAATS